MEKSKEKMSVNVQGKGKSVQKFIGKAKEGFVKAIDQNNDGTFDKEDVTAIAGAIGTVAKSTAQTIKDNAEERRKENERKLLQPIFEENLDKADFALTKLIRVTEMDKRRAESEVCQGSIGYVSDHKDLKVINIFKDKANFFGLTFYPDAESDLYYVDPSDRDRYIALDQYFEYLKIARVGELQKIAQDLGAKHFKVTYKEKTTSSSNNAIKVKVNGKMAGNAISSDAEKISTLSALSTVEIAAEMDCPGHEPIQPNLKYLKREKSIHDLISLRMDKNSPLKHQKYTLQLSNSSGIKEKDAVKIDSVLKALKMSGSTTVTSEVHNEAKKLFEYEIDF